MADLCWIENIGARGFAALAKKAPTPSIFGRCEISSTPITTRSNMRPCA